MCTFGEKCPESTHDFIPQSKGNVQITIIGPYNNYHIYQLSITKYTYCPPKRQVSKVLTTGMVEFMIVYSGTSILQKFIKFLNVPIVNDDYNIQKWLNYITTSLIPSHNYVKYNMVLRFK
jgi:ABC-type molybdate transport system substrate-binding protein